VHLTRDLAPNWKARLSWSTSFGRPPLNSLVPNETVNETQRTLTVNNPSLLPQTASNWDASLEYYFEPAGSVSVGWFRKVIKDFIISGLDNGIIPTGPDNGYSGEYGGYTLLGSATPAPPTCKAGKSATSSSSSSSPASSKASAPR
jgi:iron complex outermembrane receptor protein